MSALLLKKKYIEIKENFNRLSSDQLNYIVQNVQKSMDQSRPTMLLKRCCDILVKISVLTNNVHEIINMIQILSNTETNSMKISLYYLIEISCESAFDDTLMLKNSSIL